MPQILQGIPVEYREVRINVDAAEFMVNPTSCKRCRSFASLGGAGAGTSTPSSRFQVGDCASLGSGRR